MPPKLEMKHMQKTLLIPSLLEKPTSKLHSKERLLEKMHWELRHKARGGKAGFLPRDECWHAPVPQQRRTFPSCSCSVSPAAEPLPARSAEPAGAQSSKWREVVPAAAHSQSSGVLSAPRPGSACASTA